MKGKAKGKESLYSYIPTLESRAVKCMMAFLMSMPRLNKSSQTFPEL